MRAKRATMIPFRSSIRGCEGCLPIFMNFRFPGPLEEFLDPGPEFSAKDKEACDEQPISYYQEVDQSGVTIFFHMTQKECEFCQGIGYNGGRKQHRDADSVPNLPHRFEIRHTLFSENALNFCFDDLNKRFAEQRDR